MGATAIGTASTRRRATREKCADHLAKITGKPILLAEDLIAATWDTQAFVLYSSVLKSLAIKLAKVANDLILLSSGPRCGLARDQSAGDAAGLVDHAGQGQSGHSRKSSTWSRSA